MKPPEALPAGSAARWGNYEFLPQPLLGFHGYDEKLGEALLRGEIKHLVPSQNDYDWLGTGIYFWEGNPERALRFAQERAGGGRNSRGKVKKVSAPGRKRLRIAHPERGLGETKAKLKARILESSARSTRVLVVVQQGIPREKLSHHWDSSKGSISWRGCLGAAARRKP